LAAQIRELAAEDVFAAQLLASRGKRFSPIETHLNLYYHSLRDIRKIREGKKTSTEEALADSMEITPEFVTQCHTAHKEYFERHAQQISDIVLEAINSMEPQKLVEIAEAVTFLKTFKGSESGDKVREMILAHKQILDHSGAKWTISQVAIVLRWPKEDSKGPMNVPTVSTAVAHACCSVDLI
jgi:vacuolar-type H+-ATPase subunit H